MAINISYCGHLVMTFVNLNTFTIGTLIAVAAVFLYIWISPFWKIVSASVEHGFARVSDFCALYGAQV